MSLRIVWLLLVAALFATVSLACGGPSPSREDCGAIAQAEAAIAKLRLEIFENLGQPDPYQSLTDEERDALALGEQCDRIWTCVRSSFRSWNECVEWERSY